MVAYSFQPQFEDPILGLRKSQTIREVGRRRHARPGEELQIYRGMRTKQCRLIGRAVCAGVTSIHIDFPRSRIVLTELNGASIRGGIFQKKTGDSLLRFALADGFLTFAEMEAFWRKHHPGVDQFHGYLITWKEFRRGPDYA